MSGIVQGGRGCIGVNEAKIAVDFWNLPRGIDTPNAMSAKRPRCHGHKVRNNRKSSTTKEREYIATASRGCQNAHNNVTSPAQRNKRNPRFAKPRAVNTVPP